MYLQTTSVCLHFIFSNTQTQSRFLLPFFRGKNGEKFYSELTL